MAVQCVLASTEYLNWGNIPVSDYPFTMACWFRHDGGLGNGALISIGDSGVNDNRMELRVDNSGVIFISRWKDAVDNQDSFTVATVSADVWAHGCAVFASQTSGTIYLNGGNAVTGSTSVSFNITGNQRSRVAHSAGSGSGLFNGSIAMPAMWNVALTAGEVAALAKGFDPILIRPASLRWLLRLRRTDLVSTTQRDCWKNGFDFTEVNTPTYVDDPPLILAA